MFTFCCPQFDIWDHTNQFFFWNLSLPTIHWPITPFSTNFLLASIDFLLSLRTSIESLLNFYWRSTGVLLTSKKFYWIQLTYTNFLLTSANSLLVSSKSLLTLNWLSTDSYWLSTDLLPTSTDFQLSLFWLLLTLHHTHNTHHTQAPAFSRVLIRDGTGFCKIPGSRDFSGRD